MNQEDIEYELKRLLVTTEKEIDEMMQVSRGYIQNSAEILLEQCELERARIDTWELRDIFSGCFQREYNRINDEVQMYIYYTINQIRQGRTIDPNRFKAELLNNLNQQFNQLIRRGTEEFSYELTSQLRRYQNMMNPNDYRIQDNFRLFTKKLTEKVEGLALENKQELTGTLDKAVSNINFEAKSQKLTDVEKTIERVKNQTLTIKGNVASKELLTAQDALIKFYNTLKLKPTQSLDNPNVMAEFEELKQKWEILNEKAQVEYKNIAQTLKTELVAYTNMPFQKELFTEINAIIESEFSLDILLSEIEKCGDIHNMVEQKYSSVIEKERQKNTQQKEQNPQQIERQKKEPEQNDIENPTMDTETYKRVENIICSNPELTEEQKAIMLKILQTDFGATLDQPQEEPKKR